MKTDRKAQRLLGLLVSLNVTANPEASLLVMGGCLTEKNTMSQQSFFSGCSSIQEGAVMPVVFHNRPLVLLSVFFWCAPQT